MGNDCFAGNGVQRCHKCHATINYEVKSYQIQGLCARCKQPQKTWAPPPSSQQRLPTITTQKGPILNSPTLSNPNPFGDGLYPPRASF